MLLSHTVLSELYQEKLVTEDVVERMKRKGGNLPNRLIPIQWAKSPEVVTRIAHAMDKFGYSDEARQLRG